MKHLLYSLLFCWSLTSLAQTQYAYQTFDDTRIVNGHSVETNMEGILTFIISHRFGTLNDGAYNMWGLDNASMRMGLDYGLTQNLTLGIGRSTNQKTIDGYFKYKFLAQSTGDRNIPITASLLGTAAWKTLKRFDGVDLVWRQKMSYTTQLLLARKFGPRLSAQLMPTYLHRNLVQDDEKNDILSIGVAGQYRPLKNWSLSVEYYATPTDQLPDGSGPSIAYFQSLSFGVQIDTKGHVFQLHLSNSRGMIEKFFIAETADNWLDGGIHFGFNITRDFTVKGRNIR
ncbi:DUF5777 family beta-barrel protein [Marinoscillum furvescens]|uniref:DUF5777 domain-containing protein n=1 Tax=Marinoscillum furvescens DSM 4134 TaxID=1122208 RepID=A0A3D9LHT2_MARFU|nr:DUF5777 family beta-barrel protein [Marinoscillum furvescens]REE05579.1 hypothetical protein C7460_10196 [Marinoscillum furvescens DSM 4134]